MSPEEAKKLDKIIVVMFLLVTALAFGAGLCIKH